MRAKVRRPEKKEANQPTKKVDKGCRRNRSRLNKKVWERKLEKIQLQIGSLEAENQRTQEELEANKAKAIEKAEAYERTISELKKELEAYKREMKQNLEMIEQSLVERDALAKKNSFLRSKMKRLKSILEDYALRD